TLQLNDELPWLIFSTPGLSFALSNAADFKDIHPWTKYPGSSTHIAEHCHKAPSWVAFKDENPDLDENAWGYQIEPGMKTYAWTKLLLDDQALATEYDDPDLNKAAGNGLMRLPSGRTAKDVVTEYLKGMHSMYRKAVIEKIGEDKLEDLPVDFWLTVPATWSERAKLITRAAALDAGFASRPIDRLSLITEPDAAAHMALKSSIHHVEDLIDVGTGVMVCDLGGGTVSSSADGTVILTLSGGKCGGTFVDRNLYKLLSERFGTAFTDLGPQHVGPGSQFMDQFEMHKRDFSLDTPSRKSYKITLPMRRLVVTPEIEKYYDPDFNWVLLSKDDMKSLFDPVIDVILKLVKDQVDQVKRDNEPRIKTMCLVGGFGSSPYVKERLLEWCSEQEIRLTTPWTGAWAAVVCGAVLRGVEGSMSKQKKCRRHYGHTMSRTYDPAVHFNFDENKRRLWNDPWTKEQNLSGFMNWEIAKGALLDDDTEISTSFYSHFSEYFDGKHTHDLFSCSLDEAPETIENERIEKVGEVLYTIDGIDKTKIKSIQDANGIHWYQLLLTLTIRLSDDELYGLGDMLPGLKGYTYKTIPYKSRPSGDIVLDVVYPEEADGSPTTVLIHIHGGFLIVGDRYSFAPYWLLNAATARRWIFVSPDYRLVPESTAHASLDDSIDAYNWVRSSLADAIGRPIGSVLLSGSSAGGYLALTTANAVEHKPDALLLIYGMLDAAGPRYTTPGTNIWGAPPFDTASVLSQFPRTKQNDDRKAISGYPPPENFQQDPRFQVTSALHIDALFPDYMTGVDGLSREIANKGIDAIPEEHRRLFPLSFGDLSKIPRTFLLHGVNDTAVTIDCGIVAEKKLREAGVEVIKDFPENAEHGFDVRTGNLDVEKADADGIPNVESLRNAIRFLDSSVKN
ncbi:uncharacterized protein FOBCDRAFT_146923, partial [Fusarium oxysporum Fo47]|uniref:uncharacterized protein n=1 Tax=Fusarium oxysporum Fo47 TaxID=660027 RepID=UPI002869CC5D